MINGLFETHVPVACLERSLYFYGTVLGLELGKVDTKRRVAFYWLGKRGNAMVGLWETPEPLIRQHHYAFSSTLEDVLYQSYATD